jgi:hypothetical protein
MSWRAVLALCSCRSQRKGPKERHAPFPCGEDVHVAAVEKEDDKHEEKVLLLESEGPDDEGGGDVGEQEDGERPRRRRRDPLQPSVGRSVSASTQVLQTSAARTPRTTRSWPLLRTATAGCARRARARRRANSARPDETAPSAGPQSSSPASTGPRRSGAHARLLLASACYQVDAAEATEGGDGERQRGWR